MRYRPAARRESFAAKVKPTPGPSPRYTAMQIAQPYVWLKNERHESEALVRNTQRATRKHHAAEEKIRIVLDGLRGETSIAELCRREGIAESMYYSWSKEFLEAGKRRLA